MPQALPIGLYLLQKWPYNCKMGGKFHKNAVKLQNRKMGLPLLTQCVVHCACNVHIFILCRGRACLVWVFSFFFSRYKSRAKMM